MDIVGIAMKRRAELLREFRELDDFIRRAEMLLGNARAGARPPIGERRGGLAAAPGTPRLMWTNSGFRVVHDPSRQRGGNEPRPRDSSATQVLPWGADSADTFIFEEPSRA